LVVKRAYRDFPEKWKGVIRKRKKRARGGVTRTGHGIYPRTPLGEVEVQKLFFIYWLAGKGGNITPPGLFRVKRGKHARIKRGGSGGFV